MTTMHRTTGATRLVMLAILFGMAGRSAAAQWSGGVGLADSLLAMGRVASAESLYYAASSARPRDAAYVGDSPFDVAAARAAGVFAVAVGWGGIHRVEDADAVVGTPGELLGVL